MKTIFVTIVAASMLASSIPAHGQTSAVEEPVVIDPSGAAADGLSLREAALIALANNPQAERSRSGVELAETQVRRARSSILPQITFDGRYTRNDRSVSFDLGGEDVPILPENDWSSTLRLAQPIYAGGREMKTLRQARLAVDETGQAVRQTEEGVLFDVASSYLNVLGANALVAVEEQNVEVATRLRKQANDFYEVGEVTRVDVLRADSSIKGAQRQLASARQARETAASLLRLSMGVEIPIDPERPDLELPELPSEAELIALAEGRRPEVQRANIGLEVADLEVRKQRGAYLPVVTAEATLTQQASAFPADQFGALTVNFSVPIFTSGEIGARVAEAREREKQAELIVDQTRHIVREDVRRAIIELETARTGLRLAEDQLVAAEAEYAQVFELYQAQEATSLDVQSAESNLAEARRAVVTGNLDRELAELRIWFTAGALKSVLLQE